jgi:hypothetical protein
VALFSIGIVGMSVTTKAVGLPNKDSSATNWLALKIEDLATDLDELSQRAPSIPADRYQVPAGYRADSHREVRPKNLLWRTHF